MIFNIYLYNKYKYFVKMEILDTKKFKKEIEKIQKRLKWKPKKIDLVELVI